ncbi:MAG: di-trans,poly-cis-decaprenylcistransferase [Candidatus Terrybacteria bacterium RIFCSPLOWO2_01_FULL_44_24]|uniref:Isoprenyl transferase n=1 Tax=Candidatus Terrybacteria bacterium RIFCSPHIGHO2_01_FULL_43_35 TaxID=1802361 RepID=A0A1G2PHL4_9BACT|nr:MAG: di-trans,poly-cis-decaprenylcistransferase [Candidatus Terrybacteria bacterium RIFCSPHIGHO2_01_FULL_43_35]OHA49301.1 MAG: di-trans,poly-cis-decaprenylcistransferase [Candidatus Terrybacteria bacterium RIFCSPHIGHO2_02_FULL_43_14]OHA51999.1 MAG: di-trans,poly-cis-decaprenylcistransferase [Candidatus Terrybacteria bacterium RIFCSPLOWO2_01_FULL_44_24]
MTQVLNHVAVIPDGNRRWAKARGLKPWQGHREGFSRIDELLDVFFEEKIKFFSLWGASIDNLTKRDKREVDFLLSYLEERLNDLAKEKKIHEYKVRIRVLGFWPQYVPKSLQQAIIKAQKATEKYSHYNLTLFLAYDGRQEILRAVNHIAQDIRHRDIFHCDEAHLKQNLLTKDLPPVDLLIRTGGEPHLSGGFMLWDIADAQLYFTDKYFPEFDKDELKKTIEDYKKRERRFGA